MTSNILITISLGLLAGAILYWTYRPKGSLPKEIRIGKVKAILAPTGVFLRGGTEQQRERAANYVFEEFLL